MKRKIFAMLLLALAWGLTACGPIGDGGGPAAPAAATGPFVWDDMTFELTTVTEDLGELADQLVEPEGKYVLAAFTITEGKMEVSRLEQLVMTEGHIRLGEYTPATMSAVGIAIENDQAYAMGIVNVIFDVPTDFAPANAAVTVNESIGQALTAK